MTKAIFLDRDGVLNPYLPEDYIKSPNQWQWQKNSIKALEFLAQKNVQIFIITNQSCINRKFVSYRTVLATHDRIKSELQRYNITGVNFQICHHHPEDCCNCRKPKPGLLVSICKTYHLKPSDHWFIGDSPTDIEAGQQAGFNVAGVLTGNPKMPEFVKKNKVVNYLDLLEAVQNIKF